MDREALVVLTADIVAAHVANNAIVVSDVPRLVETVHGALSGLSHPAEPPQQKKTPIVSIRASIRPDYIVCLECGRKQKMLKRHLQTAHAMSPDQYRSDFGLPAGYPLTAPNYSKLRRDLAIANGLGTRNTKRTGKGRSGPKSRTKS